jgi:hypothetical protein
MRRPQGYAVTTMPGEKPVEEDTFTCSHCQFLVFVKPFADPATFGGFCRMCMKHICPKCTAEGTCTPFEKKLDMYERRDNFLKMALR